MRIVIDVQSLQTTSKYRGIGRYTKAITKSICINKDDDDEIILALSGILPGIDEIREEFKDLIDANNIRVWKAPGPVAAILPENSKRKAIAERIKESFLASLNPDVVLIPSLFENPYEEFVSSINLLKKLPTAVVLYDLIPLVFKDHYLKDYDVKCWYFEKLEHLKKADLILAISNYTKQDAIDLLGLHDKNIEVVYSGYDNDTFKKLNISKDEKHALLSKYNIKKEFILSVSAPDFRKNNENLIKAFLGLPSTIRDKLQLVITGKHVKEHLTLNINSFGESIVLTDYVSDEELAKLYNLCLFSIMPSYYEGFGLPTIEAMACGKAVIVSNTSSLKELVEKEEYMFDPSNISSIANKIQELFINEDLRKELENYSLERVKAFSWDKTAKDILKYCREHFSKNEKSLPNKPKLAMFSSLPPDKNGIAHYIVETLPYLSQYYELECIVPNNPSSYKSIDIPIKDLSYFKEHFQEYDRVLFHIGNNPYHAHMFDILETFRGVVILHDIYLSDLFNYMEHYKIESNKFIYTIMHSHGYKALCESFQDRAKAIFDYPCSLEIFENSLGVILHSKHAFELSKSFFSKNVEKYIKVIPFPKLAKEESFSKEKIKRELGFEEDDFLICSFGFINKIKLHDEIIKCFIESKLSKYKNCKLIFVGECMEDSILNLVKNHEEKIKITGFIDEKTYEKYLEACDIAIQLRRLSRGKTFKTVLDCMAYGIATICNANGFFKELPKDTVLMIEDNFKHDELIKAMEELFEDEQKRKTLGERAKEYILNYHSPKIFAKLCYEAIESFYKTPYHDDASLIKSIAPITPDDNELLKQLSNDIALSCKNNIIINNFFIDITNVAKFDPKTGIQRVEKSIVKELIKNPPEGFRIEPISMTKEGVFYEREFTFGLLGCEIGALKNEPIEFGPGDIYIVPEINDGLNLNFLQQMRNVGVKTYAIIYDLIPLRYPQFFPVGASDFFLYWFELVSNFDGIVAISKYVAEDFRDFVITKKSRTAPGKLKISWFHLGQDFDNTKYTRGMPQDADKFLDIVKSKLSFIMVGTLEPRKGHLQTILAFEELWQKGFDANLIIIGKQGWMVESLIEKIKNHSELNKHLFWLGFISDEYLQKIYNNSSCIIVASEAEGFGLPLVEASYHNLPIIARDIPVFREIAKECAYYFENSTNPKAISKAILEWTELYKQNKHPKPTCVEKLTWEDSVQRLLNIILNNEWEYEV